MQTLLSCFGAGRGSDGGGGDFSRVSAGSADAPLQSPPRLASDSNCEFAGPPNPFALQPADGSRTSGDSGSGDGAAIASPADFKKAPGSASQLQLPAVIHESQELQMDTNTALKELKGKTSTHTGTPRSILGFDSPNKPAPDSLNPPPRRSHSFTCGTTAEEEQQHRELGMRKSTPPPSAAAKGPGLWGLLSPGSPRASAGSTERGSPSKALQLSPAGRSSKVNMGTVKEDSPKADGGAKGSPTGLTSTSLYRPSQMTANPLISQFPTGGSSTPRAVHKKPPRRNTTFTFGSKSDTLPTPRLEDDGNTMPSLGPGTFFRPSQLASGALTTAAEDGSPKSNGLAKVLPAISTGTPLYRPSQMTANPLVSQSPANGSSTPHAVRRKPPSRNTTFTFGSKSDILVTPKLDTRLEDTDEMPSLGSGAFFRPNQLVSSALTPSVSNLPFRRKPGKSNSYTQMDQEAGEGRLKAATDSSDNLQGLQGLLPSHCDTQVNASSGKLMRSCPQAMDGSSVNDSPRQVPNLQALLGLQSGASSPPKATHASSTGRASPAALSTRATRLSQSGMPSGLLSLPADGAHESPRKISSAQLEAELCVRSAKLVEQVTDEPGIGDHDRMTRQIADASGFHLPQRKPNPELAKFLQAKLNNMGYTKVCVGQGVAE